MTLQHLLNVLVQIAKKGGKLKKIEAYYLRQLALS
jgi:hypothetical protein